jgi:hypothetical protein
MCSRFDPGQFTDNETEGLQLTRYFASEPAARIEPEKNKGEPQHRALEEKSLGQS